MDKLKLHTPNLANENYRKLAALFPNAVTETIDENGRVVRAIDKDVLMQEISTTVVEGREERYQFTWPDKRKAMLAANAPISATLRPVVADSVGRDGTPGGFDSENLYIEGDNLDVLKLLQETYLGKVKMIYIDPPYNTGNDFVYEDDFAEDTESYLARSGQFDEQGNRLEQNTESNGRFHTDWLNMMYPRLKVAKNLLADNGVIFISIDENELDNLMKVADEIYGRINRISIINWKRKKEISNDSNNVATQGEYIIIYGKSPAAVLMLEPLSKEYIEKSYNAPTQQFPLGKWRPVPLTVSKGLSGGGYTYTVTTPSGKRHTRLWAYPVSGYEKLLAENRIYFGKNNDGVPQRVMYAHESKGQPTSNYWDLTASNKEGKKELLSLMQSNCFQTPKPIKLILRMMKLCLTKNDIVLDFFSGSATTAHAALQFQLDRKEKIKYILVQLPERTDQNSEAQQAGYSTICDIGKERIRRAGRKIKEEVGLTAQNLDIGFRCLRLDSTNMEEVYYNPTATTQGLLSSLTDNIKPDRTPEDLLFQVVLDLGVDLSSKITRTEIEGCHVFDVADGYLLACFDAGVTTETVTAIAKRKPYFAVFRDSSMANDSVANTFDQIFETYSRETVRKVL